MVLFRNISHYLDLSNRVVAPLLYVIQAEAIAAAIRNKPNIQGIKLPSHENRFLETRISQIVDDTNSSVKLKPHYYTFFQI